MMKPVEILADRLSQRLSELNLSDRAGSLLAQLHHDAIREIRRGKMPNSDRLNKLALALQTTSAWLLGDDSADREARPVEALPSSYSAVSAPLPAFNPGTLAKDVPVYSGAIGTALDYSNGTPVEAQEMDLTDAVDMVRRPPGIASVKGAYALYILGDSQSPRFEAGELVFVHPHRPVSIGDDVVVQLLNDDEAVSCALVKRLLRRTATELHLRQFNPQKDFTVPINRVRAIHRILNNADLFGF